MNKDELLKQFDETAKQAQMTQDAWDTMAKQLYQTYETFYRAGFPEPRAFHLTQQYFDSMLKEISCHLKK